MVDLQLDVGPPTERALRWAAQSIAPGANVTAVRRLTGGITSPMHALTIVEANGRHHRCVLRRWVEWHVEDGPELVAREASVLESLERTTIPAPRLLGLDPSGAESGDAALLMSYRDGHVELTPDDVDDWAGQIASMLVRIHHAPVDAPVAESWLERERLVVPEWSSDPGLWRDAFSVIEESPPISGPCFVHHDYQQFNLLWRRGEISSVVDWVWGSSGDPGIDVSHARLNFSVLYSSDLAQRFLDLYESVSGQVVERWWDVEGLLKYLPGWGGFLQQQAGRRFTVDFEGMHERVESTLRAALRRD